MGWLWGQPILVAAQMIFDPTLPYLSAWLFSRGFPTTAPF